LTSKVKVAVFDKDQRIRKLQNCEISQDGSKIKISKGGKKHWYPEFDNTSYLEFPYRSLFSFWKISYSRIYFVRTYASKCLNFQTSNVPDVDLEEIEKAARNDILKGIGSEEKDTPMLLYAILALVFLSFLILLNISGVMR